MPSARSPYDQQAFSPSSKKPSVSWTKPLSSICRHVAVPLAPWFPVMLSHTVGGNYWASSFSSSPTPPKVLPWLLLKASSLPLSRYVP